MRNRHPEPETVFNYTELMKAVVRVDIEKATLILSPAYDIGHTEVQLRARYKAKFTSL